MKKICYLTLVLFTGLTVACKKNQNNTPVPTAPSKTGSTLDLIRDSIWLYAKEDYLWNDAIPSYQSFNPRSYTGADDITALTNEVNAISQLKINPSTNLPYEFYAPEPGQAKYSFIDDGAVSAELNGVKGDFGFAPFYNHLNLSDLRIKYVYPGSPADLAGIKRGYKITSINGNTELTYDGDGTSTNVNFVINAYANSSSITMVLKKPDSTSFTASLNTANYTVNPVLKDTVYTTANGHKIGYLVFNSFTSDANADPQLDIAFNNFTAQGITDLVVDLRYNGGGYVSTAEYIDNKIVSASKSGTLMYNTYYNANLVSGNHPLLGNQWRQDPTGGPDYNYGQFDYSVAGNAVNFAKNGTLAVNRVFFIITGATASASELTINNLRPTMDVEFIGETSYGKPVGFFDIDINKYQMYIPEFYTQNSANQGGYYSGFTPGTTGYPGVEDYDDVTKNFGDPSEGLLGHVFNYVQNGSYAVAGRGQSIRNLASNNRSFSFSEFNRMSAKMNKTKFSGMILKKKLKLKKRS